MTADALSLIAELRAASATMPRARRSAILQSITDLFVTHAAALSAEQVGVFDDAIGLLIEKADQSALRELSCRLATIDNAPAHVVTSLSRHDSIVVAGPVIEKSTVLADETLADLAATRSHAHLTAIAARQRVSETVTDILIDRCNSEDARKLAADKDAHFSELGFVKLINRAKADKALAMAIAARADIPPELEPFLKLVLVS